MPGRVRNLATRVVETVLASGSAVKVDDDLQSVYTGPRDGLVEVWELTLDVRFT